MTPPGNRPGTGPAHHWPGRCQARGRHCAAQSLAPHAGGRKTAAGNHPQEHPDDRSDRWSARPRFARRLAALARAPFVKIEATKFTEVGYVGKDVESIIRDLVETAVKMAREEAMTKVRSRAEDAAIERVVDIMLPAPPVLRLQQRTRGSRRTARRIPAARSSTSWSTANSMSAKSRSTFPRAWAWKSWRPPRHGGNDQPASANVFQHVRRQEAEAQDEGQGCHSGPDRGRGGAL